MPSPCPGMDPWLENPAGWRSLHLNLITEIQTALTSELRPRYYARAEERVYLAHEDEPGIRQILPDLRVIRSDEESSEPMRASAVENWSSVEVEPVLLTTMELEVHEPYVEVIDTEGRRVVTVIEVLSPSNKRSGTRGMESYQSKRDEVFASSTHFVEIDLLREGKSPVPSSIQHRGDYFVQVSRAEARLKGWVWPIKVPQRLPVIKIPLLPGDDDAQLNLQQVLNAVYDRSAYELSVDYRQTPVPPLPSEYAEWADRLLKEKGLRS